MNCIECLMCSLMNTNVNKNSMFAVADLQEEHGTVSLVWLGLCKRTLVGAGPYHG